MSLGLIKMVKEVSKSGLAAIAMTAFGVAGSVMPMQAFATTPPSGYLEAGSATSGNCAQATGEVSGSTVTLEACVPTINQKWYVNRAGYYNGQVAYTIETAKAGSFQCLSDVSKSMAPGALVNLGNCNGINSAERFVYVNSAAGGNELLNVASGECLDSSTVGSQLVLNPCVVGATSQAWFLTPNSASPR